MTTNIYTDGATLGRNGKLGTVKTVGLGVYCESPRIRISVATGGISNNEAEFKALIRGMEEALSLKLIDVHFFLDSKIVVRRACGHRPQKKYENKRMDTFQLEVLRLAEQFKYVQFSWVPREQNINADYLSKQAFRNIEFYFKSKANKDSKLFRNL